MIKRTKQFDAILSKLEEVKQFVEDQRDTQQEKFDDKSEKWQEGEKGEEAQQEIEIIETILNNLEEAFGELDNLFEE